MIGEKGEEATERGREIRESEGRERGGGEETRELKRVEEKRDGGGGDGRKRKREGGIGKKDGTQGERKAR